MLFKHFLQALLSTCSLPPDKTTLHPEETTFGLKKALSIPSILLAVFAVFAASMAVGALQATLERHLAHFDLTPVQVGLYFMVRGNIHILHCTSLHLPVQLFGGAYALPNPGWGWLADRISPKLVTILFSHTCILLPWSYSLTCIFLLLILCSFTLFSPSPSLPHRQVILLGAILLTTGFLLVGPVPFLPITPSPRLVTVAVIVSGVGLGAQVLATFTLLHHLLLQLVAAFACAQTSAIAHGAPDNVITYSLVSR